jgi:hypothetical protein
MTGTMRADPTTAPPDTLDAVLAGAFAMLARAVRDRRSAMHTPVLSSLDAAGFPDARMVVLRGFDPSARLFSVHTDRRSAKFAALGASPRVALLFYEPRARIQLRVQALATRHVDDAVAQAAWDRATPGSRRCYLGQAPGSPLAAPGSGLPAELETRAPTLDETAPGAARFAVIRARMLRLDWLHLAAGGHRRACFDWPDNAPPRATWRAP